MTTKLILVTILSRKTPYFDDETYSSHHFEAEKLHILATRPVLVTILS
ncbi:hypothetical protein NSS91_12590 [Caldifermentibacillus hisashii]